MFFHLDSGFNKLAHELLGWVMVAGAIAHAAANWPAFKRHVLSSRAGRAIIGVNALVLALSFVPAPDGEARQPPQMLALKAIARAPLTSVAPLTGRPVDALIDDLAGAGLNLPNPNASIDSVAAGDRALLAKAFRAIFGPK